MYTDLFGKTRYKVNLHMHTTLSDGKRTPAEAVQIYREKGYDALALTDHWFVSTGGEDEGITILSGVEYNVGGGDGGNGVFHILGIGMRSAPQGLPRDSSAQRIIDAIHSCGGTVVLAHPAWSLNTPEMIKGLKGIDATEIYNSVSGMHHSRRADSSLIVDMLATEGITYPLLASDDAHYYDGDECYAWIMAEAEDNTKEALLRAIRKRKFYATQGPEVHLFRDGDGYTVKSSPVREIVFLSNRVWAQRVFEGEGLTEAHYVPDPTERFLRVQVTDADGKTAWTNIIALDENGNA